MRKISQIALYLTVSISLTLVFFNFLSILDGVYIIGDTISYTQFAYKGGLLSTFVLHAHFWPPLFAILHNVASYSFFSSPQIASFSTLFFLLGSVIFLSLLLETVQVKKNYFLIAVGLALLTGPQRMLMQSYMSEPLMVLLLLGSVYGLFKFVSSNQERWLLVWLGFAAMLPLSRYIGLPITLFMCGVLLVKIGVDFLQRNLQKYSVWTVVLGCAMSIVPVSFYLLKNKVTVGSFLGERDIQNLYSVSELGIQFGLQLWNDLNIVLPISILLGAAASLKNKVFHLKIAAFLTLGTGITYLGFLFYSQTQYAVYPHLASRFTAVSYPLLITGSFLIGQLLGAIIVKKWQIPHALKNSFTVFTLLTTSFFLVWSLFGQFQLKILENKNITSEVKGIYALNDLQTICSSDSKTYLLIKTHSRNWILDASRYYCDKPVTVLVEDNQVVNSDRILSGYKLIDDQLIEEFHFDADGYDFYVYTATGKTSIDLTTVFENAGQFD